MKHAFDFDVVVVGAGATGLLAALGASRLGLRTAVCGADASVRPPPVKSRTAALLAPTVRVLDEMGVWEQMRTSATAIHGIRIVDDMGRWPRAPEILFRASELGEDALGWNIANWDVSAALLEQLTAEGQCSFITSGDVVDLTLQDEVAIVHMEDGRNIQVRLVIGADGRGSICRGASGVTVSRRDLDQVAITAILRHSRSHNHISTEFHRPAGPFTTVPVAKNESSLVWVEKADFAKGLLAEDQVGGVAPLIEERLQGLLGSITSVAGLQMFPLSFLSTDRMHGQRVVLVGEAAHVFPPIGAQGLNLGFRDVAGLLHLLKTHSGGPDAVGCPGMLKAYEEMRRGDVQSRHQGVNFLNNMLISSIAPTHLARGAALHVLNHSPFLKRQVMRLGMGGDGIPAG